MATMADCTRRSLRQAAREMFLRGGRKMLQRAVVRFGGDGGRVAATLLRMERYRRIDLRFARQSGLRPALRSRRIGRAVAAEATRWQRHRVRPSARAATARAEHCSTIQRMEVPASARARPHRFLYLERGLYAVMGPRKRRSAPWRRRTLATRLAIRSVLSPKVRRAAHRPTRQPRRTSRCRPVPAMGPFLARQFAPPPKAD